MVNDLEEFILRIINNSNFVVTFVLLVGRRGCETE